MNNQGNGEKLQSTGAELKKWNLIIDVASCTNCNLCTLAVQDEYVGNEFPGYAAEMPRHDHRWINIHSRERGQAPMVDVAYLPVLCQHCDDAPCIKAARHGAVRKRDDGIVIIDPDKAQGQKNWSMPVPMALYSGMRQNNFRNIGSSMRTCWMMAGKNHAVRRSV